MSLFLDFLAASDMRILLSRFLPVDAYANLALVCRSSSRYVSGVAADKSERKHFSALYILRPLLSIFWARTASWVRVPEGAAFEERDRLISEQQLKHDTAFAAWGKLDAFERLRERNDYNLRSDATLDIDQALSLLDARDPDSRQPMCELPLTKIMNTPIKRNAMAVGTDLDQLNHVTIGSVVMRFMWRARQYPQWLEHVLATPDAGEARRIIRSIDDTVARRLQPGGTVAYTSLMYPCHLNGYFGTVKNVISKDKPKPFNKKMMKEINAQSEAVGKLRDLYRKYAVQREAQFEADQLIPRIVQQQQGTRLLSDFDLEQILSVLKRSRASKRARDF